MQVFSLDDQSRVGEIRRAADRIAGDEGLSDSLAGDVSLVATEICTNLLKHASQGEVFLAGLSDRSDAGVEIVAVDRGPGISSIALALQDGYSSTETPGTGLGAISRRSTEFDIYTEPGKGTVLVARIKKSRSFETRIAALVKPLRGEAVSGDAWAFFRHENSVAFILADGLGHGALASRASSEAVAAFRRVPALPPADLLAKVHAALRPTRGAAVAIASVDLNASLLRYAGVGNVSGVLSGGHKPLVLISHNGTAGYHSPKMQEFSYLLPKEALLIMHSDGLHTNWNLDDYPRLRRRDPSLIAAVLYRDFARGRDDACVTVAKLGDAA